MCCYSKLCKDGSNSVCVAIVNYAMMEVTVYLLLLNSARMEVTVVCVAIVNSARMGSNSVCVAINSAKQCMCCYSSARMEVTVYVLLVNSARMEVTVYVLL